MRFAFHIALSHLRSRKSARGVSAITLVSVAGVTVGVAALNIVLSVMAGFEVDLRDKILGSNAHIVVLRYGTPIDDPDTVVEAIDALESVDGVAPFTYSEMMIRSSAGASGVILKGIDPSRADQVIDLVDNIVMGPDGPTETVESQQATIDRLYETERDDDGTEVPGIVLGEELSADLRVFVGDKVHIINPIGGGTGPFGAPVPDVQPFRVVGIFYSGMYEYDTKWTYVGIPAAQKFLKMGDEVTGVEVTVHDIYGADTTALEIEEALQYPYYARHWKDLNRNLFNALKLEKVVMGLILSLIVAVAALNIVGTLILIVMTKGREVAIMRAMGAAASQIRLVFMLEGVIIGLVGATIGTVLGLVGCWGLDEYGWPLDTDVYYLDTLPVVVDPQMVGVVACVAVWICFLATLYPASEAAAVDPVEGLRYE